MAMRSFVQCMTVSMIPPKKSFMNSRSGIQVRWAKTQDMKNLQRFFAAVYRPGHICTQKKHLTWFFQNPFRATMDEYFSAVIAEISQEGIASFLGCYPAELIVKGKVFQSAWLANWVTRAELRGRGIGSSLLQKISTAYDVTLAASFSSMAYPLYLKQQWKKLGMYRRYIGILNASRTWALVSCVHPGEALGGVEKHMYKTISSAQVDSVRNKVSRKEKIRERFSVEWVSDIDARQWDRDWLMIRRRYGATVNRTAKYLEWRFLKHPFIRYHIALARGSGGAIAGMLVLRKEATASFIIGRIVDIVAVPGCDIALIRAAVAFGEKHEYDALDTYVTFDPLKTAFRNSGFALAREVSYAFIPEFFNPLAVRARDSRKHTILIKPNTFDRRAIPKSGAWHMVKADGDRDRAY